MVGKRPHQIQRTTSMSQIRAPPAARPRIAAPTTASEPAASRPPRFVAELGSSGHSSKKDVGFQVNADHIHSRVYDDHGEMKKLDGNFDLSSNIHSLLQMSSSPSSMAKHGAAATSFMDACYLCKRPLGHGRDIFMYRGDAAFCTEECRLRQISCDERRQQCSLSASHKGNGGNTSGNSNCSRKATAAGAS